MFDCADYKEGGYKLPDRKECPGGCCPVCGCYHGSVNQSGGQDVVRCEQCDKYLYNAPRAETGREQRSVSNGRKSIKPKLRSRIIDRSGGRCERCGKPGYVATTGLHVGHVVSVADGRRAGLSDDQIDSEENLIAECDECNLGHGREALPLHVFVAILVSRLKRAK